MFNLFSVFYRKRKAEEEANDEERKKIEKIWQHNYEVLSYVSICFINEKRCSVMWLFFSFEIHIIRKRYF